VTAGAGIVDLRIGIIGQRQRIAVTQCTGGRCHLNQAVMARGVGGMQNLPSAGVTISTESTTCWQSGLKNWGHSVAQATIVVMDRDHGRVCSCARIVTVETGRTGADNVAKRQVINVAVNGQVLIRVAIQTVGRIGTKSNGIDDFLTGTIMTSRTGTGAVGGDVMLNSFNLRPGRDHVAGTTGLPRCVIREIAGAQCDRMGPSRMDSIKPGSVTGCTVTAGGEVLLIGAVGGHQTTVGIVTGCTAVVGIQSSTGQSVIMTGRTTGAGCAGTSDRDQGSVARGIDTVGGHPSFRVTGLTGPAGGEVFTNGQALQGTGSGIVTTGTVEVRLNADQGVVVTATAVVGTSHGYQSRMVGNGGMQGIPSADVTG